MFESFKTRARLRELEEGLEKLERQFKRQEVEWLDTLDKLRTMMGRITKDRARAEAARAEEPSQAPGEAPVAADGGLSARQEEINSRILARRNRLHQ